METFDLKLKVASFQFRPEHLSPEKNFVRVREAVLQASDKGAHLILLPELWSCGLLETGKQAASQAGKTENLLKKLKTLCSENHIHVAGSLPEPGECGRVFNTLYVTGPGDFSEKYRKIHLFPMLKEEKIFNPGDRAADIWIDTGAGKPGLGCLVCFDIRFPELARSLAFRGVDILLCSALWPMARRRHFEIFLRARAMENQCFLLASNACGRTSGVDFAGSSSIIAPDGEIIGVLDQKPGLLIREIDLERKKNVRKAFFTARPASEWAFQPGEKVRPLEELKTITRRRKAAGQKMVFTNGCFDILHAGHVSYLRKARLSGDFLVVGLNSDSSIKVIKGSRRPVNPEADRAMVLSALAFVDYLVIFRQETPEHLIRELQPDVLVKGADWEEKHIVGADFVKSLGGRVERIKFDIPVSTTDIIKKIRKNGS